MEVPAKPSRRPRREPLGWVAFAGLALAVWFWGSAWLWHAHEQLYYKGYWLLWMPLSWLLLAGLGILALGLAIKNLLQGRGWRTFGWFLVVSFAVGNCLVGLLPLAVSLGLGTTTEVPQED